MGAILDRARAAVWGTDPTVPDPGEPVRAAQQPGGIRPALQEIYSRIWSMLQGKVRFGPLMIEIGGGDGAAPSPALAATEGLRVVLTRVNGTPKLFLTYDSAVGLRVWGGDLLGGFDQLGNFFVRDIASQRRVVIDQGSLAFLFTAAAAVGVKVRNTLLPEHLPRCWGRVTMAWDSNGVRTVTLTDGVGIASVSVFDNGLIGMLRVTMAQDMDTSNYVVQSEGESEAGVTPKLPLTSTKTTSTFDLVIYSLSTSPASVFSLTAARSNAIIRIGFTVFGRQ